jgi:CubicO group peptidase (beta-lactamase class C family)
MNVSGIGIPCLATCRFTTRARVPASLASVTTVRRDAEVDPGEVGVDPAAVERIWAAVERLYRSGIHPAIQLCVRRHGQVVLDRAIGHARGNGPHDLPDAAQVLVTPDTPFTVYSASKAVTAMVVHLLDERNLLRLDDRVCEYVPEFGVHGKKWITIRHVLTHRAGVPTIPAEALDLELLRDPERVVDILCAARPIWRAGRWLAYHTISGGFILGEVVRRVCGRDIRAVLDTEVCRPLGLRWLNYGVAPEDVERVAVNYFTGPALLPPATTIMRRALSADFHHVIDLSNDPRFMLGIVPSANVVATANEMSLFYQILLDGGELDGVRIFDRRTIQRATVEQSYLEFDLTLGLPLRYGMGFMLGGRWFSFYGPGTSHAFGHLGFTNIITWADPERDVAAALLTSGKPVVYPQIIHLYDVLAQIGRACPKG